MSERLTRDAYMRLVREDLDWLRAQPRSLERDHIESLLSEAAAYAYPEDDAATVERVARVLHRQTAVRSWEGASGLEQDQCRRLARVLLRALPAPHAPDRATREEVSPDLSASALSPSAAGCARCGERDPARRLGRCQGVPGSEHDWRDPFKGPKS